MSMSLPDIPHFSEQCLRQFFFFECTWKIATSFRNNFPSLVLFYVVFVKSCPFFVDPPYVSLKYYAKTS